jgi:hypothetical protein
VASLGAPIAISASVIVGIAKEKIRLRKRHGRGVSVSVCGAYTWLKHERHSLSGHASGFSVIS